MAAGRTVRKRFIYPRRNAAICNLGMMNRSVNLGIESPGLLACCRIKREDDCATCWQIEPAFDQYRIGLVRKRLPMTLAEFARTEPPGFFEPTDVVGRNL